MPQVVPVAVVSALEGVLRLAVVVLVRELRGACGGFVDDALGQALSI